jgi:hypothetical protein
MTARDFKERLSLSADVPSDDIGHIALSDFLRHRHLADREIQGDELRDCFECRNIGIATRLVPIFVDAVSCRLRDRASVSAVSLNLASEYAGSSSEEFLPL